MEKGNEKKNPRRRLWVNRIPSHLLTYSFTLLSTVTGCFLPARHQALSYEDEKDAVLMAFMEITTTQHRT